MTRAALLVLLLGLPGGVGVSYREMLQPPAADWPTYSGDFTARRYSALAQIDTATASRLAPQWVYHVDEARHLETTPLVVDGVMIVTSPNQVDALDARTGRPIWRYRRASAAKSDVNRGAAMLDHRVFFTTGDAHLVALHATTGAVLWDSPVGDVASNKFLRTTGAPLAVDGKVIVGIGGGDCGIRGFVDAYDAATGKRLWRFWTIPARGEPGSETWGNHPPEVSGGATWMTGTYDPEQNLVLWTTGNPGPDWNGAVRPGDNLYTDCVVALDADTGALRWYFQFTPHDTHDWDATTFPVLIDAVFQGQPRRLVVQANRNGFLYVLDRTTGRMLLAKPFVRLLTWARGIRPDGRPDVVPGSDPTPAGVRVCPGVVGATNWFSPSWNPRTGLFYVMALERCDVYKSSARPYAEGECYSGTAVDQIPAEPGQFFLRALDIQTGALRWEIPIEGTGRPSAWPGTLTTAGGLVFFGDDAGYLSAADARTGRVLWHFNTGQKIFASPMTYSVAGKQYVALANATEVFAFGLFDAGRRSGAPDPAVPR